MKNYQTLEEVREYLTANGFTEYRPTPFTNESVTTCFQKKVSDNDGIKYFINVDVWDYTWTNRIPEQYVVEYRGQYYQQFTHNALDVTFIDWELSQVESFLDNLFVHGIIEYYERY